ncbi:MAG: tetratricopeptide repeat protein [Zetaproteobacteria bacterium]|nr:tetratricopeptide repeat protein [Zetaproteobacteria bacterium]
MKQNKKERANTSAVSSTHLQKKFSQALAHHQAGRLSEAEKLYQQILSKNPRHADALHLLGVIACQTGVREHGIALIQQALALSPNNADFHANLAHAFNAHGEPHHAIFHYEQALITQPDYAGAAANIQALLQTQWRRAFTYYQSKRWNESESLCNYILSKDANHTETLHLLGVITWQAGRLARGINLIQQALAHDPNNADFHSNLARALHDQGNLAKAITHFEQALAIRPNFPEALCNFAKTLQDLEKPHEAIARYEQALAIRPNFPEALCNLGSALQEQGKLSEAIARYEQALAINPEYAEVQRNLSMLKTYQPDDPQIAVMQQVYAHATQDSSRMQICFALAKANEDIQQIEKSFALYTEANQIRKRELGYNIEQDKQLFQRIKHTFSQPLSTPPIPLGEEKPILIVGMPRSGTSLVEQILASHSALFGAGELDTLNDLVARYFLKVKASDFDLATASHQITSTYLKTLNAINNGDRFITDKMPLNFRWLGFLMLAQPDIRIIHINRDPMAVCWSNFKRYFPAKGIGFAYDQADLAEYYRMHEELMQFWHSCFPDRIYELSYEKLTENQEEETRKLLDYCGLTWEPSCLEFEKNRRIVKTASAAQVRNKMYQRSSEVWQKFEPHLEAMKQILARMPTKQP